jgi:hypothetical protein|tara:strand:- start:37 stop:1203 length:1167 start_codon:yes stop_codon:yes gene_type:complete
MNKNYLINDSRKSSMFSKKTFSNYVKKDTINMLEKNLILSKLHEASFLAIELHISMYNNLVLETIFNTASLYTNIDYPKMPNQLYQLYLKYLNALKECDSKCVNFDNRNNQEIRNIFSHLVSICCLAPKNNNFQLGLLTKISDLDFEYFIIKKNIKSSSLDLTKDMFFENEPNELILVLNEIAYLLREEKENIKDIFYWISWMIELEKKHKKNKQEFNLKPRKIDGITEKLSAFWEWILWNIILNEVYFRNKPDLYQQIYALYNFYKFNFKKSSRKKYMIYINHSIYLLKKNIDFKKNPLEKKQNLIIQSILGNNSFYRIIFDKSEKKYFIKEDETPKKTESKTNNKINNKEDNIIKDNKPSETKTILNKKQLEEKKVNERMNYLFLY